ncbi:DUF6328 family protein [Rhodococcus sp. NPDC055112]
MTPGHDAADHPERDAEWDRSARHETATERLDRNWASILQELRVVQTGVQLLTGFLLILPFQERFAELSTYEQWVYLATVILSIAATVLLIAPVGMHRILFRQRKLDTLVTSAHRFELWGLILLGLTLTGVVMLIIGTVIDPIVGAIAGGCAAIAFGYFWIALPLRYRRD